MYSVDALCRRSGALQQTVQAQSRFLGLNPADADRLGLKDGGLARVRQGENSTELEVRVSAQVPVGGAWVRSAICSARELEQAVAAVVVEVA
jgi:anaerobic selenocysteine-containing dehydrogenase